MLNYKKLHITYVNPTNTSDGIIIDYNLRNTPIAKKWIQRVLLAQKLHYPIDNPDRFYGFGTIDNQKNSALTEINLTIKKLNKWINIDYDLDSVEDQDTLNRLHHIFEKEHGLLNVSNNNKDFRQNLCDLNILIHKCESIARGAHPRHVVTYFGLPKTEILQESDYQYFDSKITYGSVYLNYVEIGKTLFDLMLDHDTYIEPAAFQPFKHYSADFVIKFWNDENSNLKNQLQAYYNTHQQFFKSLGYTWEYLSKSIGGIPVADLCTDLEILELLQTRQFVKAVHFS